MRLCYGSLHVVVVAIVAAILGILDMTAINRYTTLADHRTAHMQKLDEPTTEEDEPTTEQEIEYRPLFPQKWRTSGGTSYVDASNDFTYAAMLCNDEELNIVNIEDGSTICVTRASAAASKRSFTWMGTEKIAFCEDSNRIAMLDISGGGVDTVDIELRANENIVSLSATLGSGLFVATKRRVIWNKPDGTIEQRSILGEDDIIVDMISSPEFGVAVVSLEDGRVVSWEFLGPTQSEIFSSKSTPRTPRRLVAMSSNGTYVVLANSYDSSLQVIRMDTKEEQKYDLLKGVLLDVILDERDHSLTALVATRALERGTLAVTDHVIVRRWGEDANESDQELGIFPSRGDQFFSCGIMANNGDNALVAIGPWFFSLQFSSEVTQYRPPPSVGIGALVVDDSRVVIGCNDDVSRIYENLEQRIVPTYTIAGGRLIDVISYDAGVGVLTASVDVTESLLQSEDIGVTIVRSDEHERFDMDVQGVVTASFGKDQEEVYLVRATGAIERWTRGTSTFSRDENYVLDILLDDDFNSNGVLMKSYIVDNEAWAVIGVAGPSVLVVNLTQSKLIRKFSGWNELGLAIVGTTAVNELQVSQDGSVIVAHVQGSVVTWTDGNWKDPWVLRNSKPYSTVGAIALTKNGKSLVIARDWKINTWDVESRSKVLVWNSPKNNVVDLSVTSPGGALILTCADRNAYWTRLPSRGE